MAQMRLTPTTYSVSSTNLTVADASNMYNNTDNDTYATVTNTYTGTTSYYIYISGFDFNAIPEAATVNSFTVKFKARESGVSTSTNYRPMLMNGTGTTLTGTCNMPSTTATVLEFTGVTATWDTIKGYGNNFSIRINCRRNSRNTTGYMYIYGAEILVDYFAEEATVTSSLTGNGTINPNGTTSTYVGMDYDLTIVPDVITDEITVIHDGIDVSSQVVAHYPDSGGTISSPLGAFTLVSGSFNSSGSTYFQGLVGKGVDASTTTSNYYSGGSGVIAVFTYDMPITIPSNATVERVYCQVNGHAESTSNSSEYMCAMLISGSTELTDELNFKSIGTSNTTQTLECETLPTIAQLENLQLQCRLGYYGGAINGATVYVVYSVPSSADPEYFLYSFTVTGNSTIQVTIGGSSEGPVIYIKTNGSWSPFTKAYKKISGTWVQQSDLTSVFQAGINYVKGGE